MRIDDYRILPVDGGGICVVGTVDGRPWRTTEIRRFRAGEVETASGTRYRLGAKHVSLWSMQLQMRRTELHAKLDAYGLV